MKEPELRTRRVRRRRGAAGAAAVDDGEAVGGVRRRRGASAAGAACWPRIAVSATVAEAEHDHEADDADEPAAR